MSSIWENTAPAPITPISAPEIIVGPDQNRVIDEAVAALARAPELYQRPGELVEVITDDPNTRGLTRRGPIARIQPCREPRISEVLSREGTWLRPDGGGGVKRGHPPHWAVRGVMARGKYPGIRSIVGVATAATMRPDGSILSRAGYDDQTEIYLEPSVEVEMADQPTREDARRAIGSLLDLLCDFPAPLAAKIVWVAAVVTIAVRSAIDGPVPLFLIDASVRGSGKSLLVDCATVITTGRPAARMIYSHDDSEMRKTITAVALAGDPVVLLDNVVGALGCPSLDAALTADTWRDRRLGTNSMTTELPLRLAFFATGNGMEIAADLVRRALPMRLEPDCERPEERTGFRYPRLLDHVRTHRADLLSAALTIPRAFVVAGRPDMNLRPMGSFERWSDLVRSAVFWTGQPDPCDTIAELRAADVRTDALHAMVAAWPAADGESVTASKLIDLAVAGSPWRASLNEWCSPCGDAAVPTAKALGYALRAVRGRVVAGAAIQHAPRGKQGAQWTRMKIGAGADDVDSADAAPLRGHEPFTSPIGETSTSSSPSTSDREPGDDDDDPEPAWRAGT